MISNQIEGWVFQPRTQIGSSEQRANTWEANGVLQNMHTCTVTIPELGSKPVKADRKEGKKMLFPTHKEMVEKKKANSVYLNTRLIKLKTAQLSLKAFPLLLTQNLQALRLVGQYSKNFCFSYFLYFWDYNISFFFPFPSSNPPYIPPCSSNSWPLFHQLLLHSYMYVYVCDTHIHPHIIKPAQSVD